MGVEMERKPESQLIFGCHSMIMSLESAQKSYDLNMGEHTGTIVHCYRTRFDVCPMYWGHVMAHNHYGTIGTTSAIRADLAYRTGFLPDLPAGDIHEHHFACMGSAPFSKMNRPILVTDRVSDGAKATPTDKLASHDDRLNAALNAIHAMWVQRGRLPLTYDELEDRYRSRFKRRQDFEINVLRGTNTDEQWVTDDRIDEVAAEKEALLMDIAKVAMRQEGR